MPVELSIVETVTALGTTVSQVVIDSASTPGPPGPPGPAGTGGGAVDSVNDQTGVVVLDAADVGAATAAQGTTADTAIQPGTGAGGVLAGTFPNPTFAADMATQAELNAEAAMRSGADNTLISLTTALNERLDVIEGDYATQGELDAVAAAKQPLDADLSTLAAAGNSAVLAATTAPFLTDDKTKLDGIEAGATADQAATEVPIADTGGYFTSSNVEGALQEIGASGGARELQQVAFAHTGAAQDWTVPAGVTAILVELVGAGGGRDSSGFGGHPYVAKVSFPMSVTPAESLRINVGGLGGDGTSTTGGTAGFNGGAAGAKAGGGGGGATDIRQGGTALANRVGVAGGAGGAGGNGGAIAGNAGTPNGSTGANGAGGAAGQGGEGGTTSAGGAGGALSTGVDGTAGSSGAGGAGGAGFDGSARGGGGGAGGYFGGGGGEGGGSASSGGGGGGGSSLVPADGTSELVVATVSRHGYVIINYVA